jgi:hypothetical protein
VAAAIWIVRKSTNNRADTIDGIETVIINNDDLDNEATTLAGAEAALQTAGYDIPSGYFDTAALALSAGQLDTDQDLVAMGERLEIIA